MTKKPEHLTFTALREANMARIPQFKNSKGQLAHNEPDGSDWSPSQWLQALIGELGEFANFRKKYERGDLTAEEFKKEAGKELADVMIYLDILAARCLDTKDITDEGIDLGRAVHDKFNEVSVRVGSNVYIGESPPWMFVHEFPPPVGIWLRTKITLETEEETLWKFTGEKWTNGVTYVLPGSLLAPRMWTRLGKSLSLKEKTTRELHDLNEKIRSLEPVANSDFFGSALLREQLGAMQAYSRALLKRIQEMT